MNYTFSTAKKILLVGGSGSLGSQIKKLIKCVAPDSEELDITRTSDCRKALSKYNPDIVIHCAAYTDVAGAEKEKKKCFTVNVLATENLIRTFSGRRFVYISTEYVFDGTKGFYKESDVPNPVNFYSLTKLLGEFIVRQYHHTLVIRTSFKPDGPWHYPKAFVDQWTSADFAGERAPDIVRAALMEDLTGIIHIGGKRKSIYALAKKASPHVGKAFIKDLSVKLPRDTSLDASLWKKVLSSRAKK